jgi:cell division protein FtsQ
MAIKMNPYVRKSLYVVALFLIIALFAVLKGKQETQHCSEILISISAPLEKQLITERIIQDKLDQWYSNGLSGVAQKDINLREVELKIEEMPAVKKAEVSFDLRGILSIDIEQRIPVIRIVPKGKESYYLDNSFVKIPDNDVEVARVPIANGVLSAAMIKKVYTLSTYVQENAFIEALSEQIFVNNKGDLVIVPKIKNQKIVVGDTNNIEEKFKKLIDFYNEGLNKTGWDTYQTINLKYKDQVVCN